MDQPDIRLVLPADQLRASEPKEELVNPLFPQNAIPQEEAERLLKQPIVDYRPERDVLLGNRLRVSITFEEQTFDFLVEEQLTVRDLLLYIRGGMKLGYWEAVYLGYQNTIFSPTQMILMLYNRYQVDNKLSMVCRKESTFG